ncbi:type III pantothenate kinase [Ideonella sp. 4Y16]|uniref:Type III pantothenate kinase n=1 Tax=Ideonella alba TaxID=2824118 RepID=A0A940YAM2_9BURK|nr:type III pantothenate kinase [Ideonella alba]MBQ0933024.1 type III pantothenate kinase [Ideonella alba]MBQ0945731.1 type III pantothenate kinase [Ideonella alba]
MSFLAIDIGNTRLKWAQYASPQPGAALLAHGAVFLETIDELAEKEWRELAPPHSMLGCVVAGEAVRRRVEEQLELWDLTPRWVVSSPREAGLVNGYDHPARLGADRWVAMIGARGHVLARGPARPALVVMIGTAVTVDAIDREGHFLGGLILPGHGIMLRALESGTAGLRVPTGEVMPFPANTSDALTSGGTYAITGAIERMRRHLRERSQGEEPLVLITGGAGWKVAPYLDMPHELLESLIFDGLLNIQSHRLAL